MLDINTKVVYPVVERHQLPQTEVSLMELEAVSRRPDPITKLSPKVVKLLQTYGILKVEEWKQKAESRRTSQTVPGQAAKTATTADAEPEPGEPIQESTPLLPRRLMTCAMEESGEIEELASPVVPPEGEQSGAEAMTTECVDQTIESEPPAPELLHRRESPGKSSSKNEHESD